MTDHIDTSPEAVERLLDGVTPGPWDYIVRPSGNMLVLVRDANGNPKRHIAEMSWSADERGESDARFIAAARQLVPALSAERDRRTAENAAMVAILKEAERMCIEGYPVSAFNVARAALAASQPRKTDTNGG